MTTGLLTVTHFLLNIFFSLVIFILWIRLFLRYYRISTLHPISQLIYRVTNPVLAKLERMIYPKGQLLPRYDWVCFVFLLIVEWLKFSLLALIMLGGLLPLHYLFIYIAADLIVQPCNLLFYALVIRVIMSWVNPLWRQHPAADILLFMTEPLISLGRRIIPDISGFDFSPFIIMVILKVITLFVQATLPIPFF